MDLQDIKRLLSRIADFAASPEIVSAKHFKKLFGFNPEEDQQEGADDSLVLTFTHTFDQTGPVAEIYASTQSDGAFFSLELSNSCPIKMNDLAGLFGDFKKDPFTGDGRSAFECTFRGESGSNAVHIIAIFDAPDGGRMTTINFSRSYKK